MNTSKQRSTLFLLEEHLDSLTDVRSQDEIVHAERIEAFVDRIDRVHVSVRAKIVEQRLRSVGVERLRVVDHGYRDHVIDIVVEDLADAFGVVECVTEVILREILRAKFNGNVEEQATHGRFVFRQTDTIDTAETSKLGGEVVGEDEEVRTPRGRLTVQHLCPRTVEPKRTDCTCLGLRRRENIDSRTSGFPERNSRTGDADSR